MLNPACSTTPVANAPRLVATASESRNALAAILTPGDLLLDLDVPTKNRALQEIARFVGARHGLPERTVYASLVGREAVGSTALGCGVAVPHARVKGLSRPIAVFVRMKFAIPFDAPDGKPVSDMFVLLVPQQATDAHLLLLAEVAAMCCDPAFREDLRTCAEPADVHAAFARWRQS